MANAASMAGHVEIGEGVVIGGVCGISQFCRIGTQAFLGGMSGVRRDIIPYAKASGTPCGLYGLNLVGLKRRGYTKQTISALYQAYKILFMSSLSIDEAVEATRQKLGDTPEVNILLDFIATAERGLTRPREDSY
jgi:UDP-N-acetylglucosamine acyltransferase